MVVSFYSKARKFKNSQKSKPKNKNKFKLTILFLFLKLKYNFGSFIYFLSSVAMDVFKRIGALAEFLDDELHKIEASYRIILESSRRYEGPAEIACDFREEIQDLNRLIDSLIVKGEDQHEDFQRFLDNMTETIEKFDEKIDKVENYAAKYGYIKPVDGKEKIDLRKSLLEVEKQPSSSEVSENLVVGVLKKRVSGFVF